MDGATRHVRRTKMRAESIPGMSPEWSEAYKTVLVYTRHDFDITCAPCKKERRDSTTVVQ